MYERKNKVVVYTLIAYMLYFSGVHMTNIEQRSRKFD